MRRLSPTLACSLFGPLLFTIPATADWTTEGRVVALDALRPAVTLDNGPVANLLPAARTEFPVARQELLHGVALGDAVRVTLAAESDAHGILTITSLEASPDSARAGPQDGSRTVMVAIGAAILFSVGAFWLEIRRVRRSLAEVGQALLDATRRHTATLRTFNADVEAAAQALGEIARTVASQLASATVRIQLASPIREAADRPAAPNTLPLFVVQAGDVDTYRMLSERLARQGRANVMWDRRRRDRRTGRTRVSQDRRRRERRDTPPPTWLTLGYVAVPPASERRLTAVARGPHSG